MPRLTSLEESTPPNREEQHPNVVLPSSGECPPQRGEKFLWAVPTSRGSSAFPYRSRRRSRSPPASEREDVPPREMGQLSYLE